MAMLSVRHVVALLALASACRGADRVPARDTTRVPAQDTTRFRSPTPAAPTAASTIIPHWPEDVELYQLDNLDSLKLSVPSCGDDAMVTPDSVGAFRLGQTLKDVGALCPGAVALWTLADEGVGLPWLVARIGRARFELGFDETLPGSTVTEIATRDSAARTAAGVGPG